MSLRALVYVSRSLIDPDAAEEVVGGIVAAAIDRNKARGITGGLIFTGMYFAQVLEGGHDELAELMGTISRDTRHTDIMIVADQPLVNRGFGSWNMAYSGPSRFISGHITRLTEKRSIDTLPANPKWLLEIMKEFSRTNMQNAS